MADTHGASRGDTERHHERERGEVDRDLMRRQRCRREAPRQRRRRGKHSDFERHLRGGRQPKREEFAHWLEVNAAVRSDRSVASDRLLDSRTAGGAPTTSFAIENDGEAEHRP